MSPLKRHWHWTFRSIAALIVIAVATGAVLWFGFTEGWLRHKIVSEIAKTTGARVELRGFRFHPWTLRAELYGLTLHGLEDTTSAPLFHADKIEVDVRIVSFIGRKIALDELIITRPELTLKVAKDGRSNLPTPKQPSNRAWQDSVFDLQIGRFELRDGSASLNDRRVPLAANGRNLEFALRWVAPSSGGGNSGTPAGSYVGSLQWRQVELAERGDRGFRIDLSAKFTLHPNAFELDDFVCKLPRSELDLRAEVPNLAVPAADLHYRGRLSLEDLRVILRQQGIPAGMTEFSGQAHYADGAWTAAGHYAGHQVDLPYDWFHVKGVETSGDYEIAREKLFVPNFGVKAFGGVVQGKVQLDFHGFVFRSDAQFRGASLAGVLAALDNPAFPVKTLHWDSVLDVDAVNTWEGAFKHYRVVGEARWTPPATLAPGMIPAAARLDCDYSWDKRAVVVSHGEITTPKSRLEFSGPLASGDSSLELNARAGDLSEWADFVNTLQGENDRDHLVGGTALWKGRILGPLGGPTFVGHLLAGPASFGSLYWDSIDGQLEYSPDDFRLSSTTVRRGSTTATMDLALQLDRDWDFDPSDSWTLEAHSDRAATTDIQALFGTNYPITGTLSGDFRGGGTRASPVYDANFTLDDIEAEGIAFNRFTGRLHMAGDEIRLSNAVLTAGTGRASGDVAYHPAEHTWEFDVAGSDISLARIRSLQSPSIAVAGLLTFNLRGSGPLLAPVGQGDFRLSGLKAGSDVQGDLTGILYSDGQTLRVTLASDLIGGKLNGELEVGLTGDNRVSGHVTVEQIDMDAFIVAGLHLKQLTGHSSVDGTFAISGALRQPDSIEITADISKIGFNYEFVQLQNEGPIRLSYRRNEVRVDQAHLKGADTDLQLSGTARFDRDRPLRLTLSGDINLRILGGILPDVEARGSAHLNVDVQGTFSRPRITGRASVHDASANYADFPVGLSRLNGNLVFDTSRLLFDHVTAEAGGGQLTLSGSVSYLDGQLRYDVSATTPTARIRYPVGMSWLIGGTIELSGTTEAALLSGHVQVQRVLFAEGVDIGSLFAAASDTSAGPASTSAFLRNLSFDVEGRTTPGARIEWAAAHVEMEGDVRLRGTWDHPVLLGHVHLLGGQMQFRGNQFDLTRGDLDFANPFRIDPVLNVEATSTISQYQVTIDFTGPSSRLSLNYRSDPPLPDSDILALLALGSTGEESALRGTGAQSQNYGATALLSEAISSGLGGRIEHLFGISNFRVDPFLAGTATESNAAARVTIEQQITRDLSVTYSTNAATTNQYQLIQVEYAVRRDLSVVFLRDINGTYGFDVRFVKHFK